MELPWEPLGLPPPAAPLSAPPPPTEFLGLPWLGLPSRRPEWAPRRVRVGGPCWPEWWWVPLHQCWWLRPPPCSWDGSCLHVLALVWLDVDGCRPAPSRPMWATIRVKGIITPYGPRNAYEGYADRALPQVPVHLVPRQHGPRHPGLWPLKARRRGNLSNAPLPPPYLFLLSSSSPPRLAATAATDARGRGRRRGPTRARGRFSVVVVASASS